MSALERTPLQNACNELINIFREVARPIEEGVATLARISRVDLHDDTLARDIACLFHNIGVDLRMALRKGPKELSELASRFLESERQINHALERKKK